MTSREMRITIGLAFIAMMAMMPWTHGDDESTDNPPPVASQRPKSEFDVKGEGWTTGFDPITQLVAREQLVPAGDEDVNEKRLAKTKSRLLVAPSDLLEPKRAGRMRVVDVRPQDIYQPMHIPGAAWCDLAEWVKEFSRSRDTFNWEKRIGGLGIDQDTTVVVYDDGSCQDAASLRSILQYWGVKDVRLLNGGWPAWLLAGAHQSFDVPNISPRAVKLKPDAGSVVSKEQVVRLLQTGRAQIVDAHSVALTVRGEEQSPHDAEAESLRHLGFNNVIDERFAMFKPAGDLTKVFHSADINPARPTVVCGESLGEAAAVAFALELTGAQRVRICFAGWIE